jgi:ABC-2 type transport system ATP-binding protein
LIKNLGGDHTLLLSTHILPEVEAVCDRAIVIAGGRIVASGSPDELRASRG